MAIENHHIKHTVETWFPSTGETKFGDVHRLLIGLADSFQPRSDSCATTRGLRRQPENDNQESF